MKYFAKLDSDNKVIGFTHVDDSRAPTEQAGIDLLSSDLGHSNWKEYHKRGAFRKHGAVVGYTYDADRDAFIPPQPYPSWTLNEDTCNWHAPVEPPDDYLDVDKIYRWNEGTRSWEAWHDNYFGN
tara:strand:+ start:96 stop:470 length:375 start_codon:yes stop_codon:yes gene_type:complete